MVPAYSAADYLSALQALMPRGRAWPLDNPASTMSRVLAALAQTLARVNTACARLIADAFPATANALLPEWEATLGLPDPCIGSSPLLSQRQAQVVARLANSGGQSVPYFTALAATLGFPITITEYTGANAHQFQVNAPTVHLDYFRAGSASAGDPLDAGGNAELECLVNELKPAHTTVVYHYS